MPPKTVPKSDRKRHKITDAQRAALRQQYATQKQSGGAVDHKSMARWFQNTFQFPIDLSMVSRYLGPRYKHLDLELLRPDASKTRTSHWPLLEEALFEWEQRAQNGHLVISGDILKEKAAQFWPTLYPGIEPPKFSTGWLEGFKARYSIKSYKKHGEDADVDVEKSAEAIHNIRLRTAFYALCNIYNMDESGLYWKMMLDRSLSTEQLSGTKREKSRISLAITGNGDGTERVPVWAIGSAKKPRCFKNINIDNLNIKWRANKKAWMTTAIMKEYLLWFWSYLQAKKPGKRVLLLLDNHSAHTAAVEALQEEKSVIFNTIEVVFLPPNTTSRYQPCDQGIIATFKLYYRRYWTRYLLQEFEEGRNGRTTVNVLKALKWVVQAWHDDIKDTTILNCFHKSTIQQTVFTQQTFETTDFEASVLYSQAVSDLQGNIDSLQQVQIVKDALDVNMFMNPIEENAEIDIGDLDQDILNQFTQGPEFESDEEVEDQPVIKAEQALAAAQMLELWHLQQDDSDSKGIEAIRRQIAKLEVAKQVERQGAKQGKLDDWFKKV